MSASLHTTGDADDSPSFVPFSHTIESILASTGPLDTLGFPSSLALSDVDVRKAYRTLALQFHPDKLTNTNDEQSKQHHATAFIRVSEAFALVKTEPQRRQIIQDAREQEIWREMQIQKEREKQERDAASNSGVSRFHVPATSSASKPASTATTKQPRPSGATAAHPPSTAAPAPISGAFPSFSGAKFKPASYTFHDVRPSSHASRSAATSSTASTVPSRTTFDVTSALAADDFAAQLRKWTETFAEEMHQERENIGRKAMGVPAQKQLAMEAKIGAGVFSRSAVPSPSEQALVPKNVPSTAPTNTVPVTAAAPLSRLQQLRARQGGVSSATVVTSSTVPSSAISAATREFLVSGGRLKLRVVTQPGAKPVAPVAVSVWLSSNLKLFQYRLASSNHSQPDGSFDVSSIASVKKVQKSTTSHASPSITPPSAWFSIVQLNGQTMTLEAVTNDLRDQWCAKLQEVLTTMQSQSK